MMVAGAKAWRPGSSGINWLCLAHSAVPRWDAFPSEQETLCLDFV